MCAEFEQCCVTTCLCLLSLIHLSTTASTWNIRPREDVLSVEFKAAKSSREAEWVAHETAQLETKKKLVLGLLPFGPRKMFESDRVVEEYEYATLDPEKDEDSAELMLDKSELKIESELLAQKVDRTKFTPIPGDDSDDDRDDEMDSDENEMESLSVVWYLGAFGGLVTFFLVIVCSEFCFGNTMYRRHNPNEYINRVNVYSDAYFPQTPPPPYHLFAPPPYTDTLQRKFDGAKNLAVNGVAADSFEKDSYKQSNIYIVPVHDSKMPAPPSYTA